MHCSNDVHVISIFRHFSLEKEKGRKRGWSPPIPGFESVDSYSLFVTEVTQTRHSLSLKVK